MFAQLRAWAGPAPPLRVFLHLAAKRDYANRMTDQIAQTPACKTASAPRRHSKLARVARLSPWSAGAFLIALLVLMPLLAVVWIAFHPSENIWPHLISTTLPRYMRTTAVLAFGVAGLSACVGTGAAWLVTMYRFPLSKALEWLLLLPLAIPAYVGAYALVDFLEYAGPVQGGLRQIFGWQTSRDYWFPEIRSLGSAIIVLAAALTPYVFLLTRAAFREQSGSVYETARALGAGPFARFWRVGLPLARPAIAASTAIVMMETVSDYGTVSYFAVQTLTTGIFSTWLEGGNAGGAAQIATVVLVVVLLLVGFEKSSRGRARFHQNARQTRDHAGNPENIGLHAPDGQPQGPHPLRVVHDAGKGPAKARPQSDHRRPIDQRQSRQTEQGKAAAVAQINAHKT